MTRLGLGREGGREGGRDVRDDFVFDLGREGEGE